MSDELWRTVEKALAAHDWRGRDRAYLFSLNRIFHKYVSRDGLVSVPLLFDETCEITQHVYGREDLTELELYHERPKPARQDGPIVVVEFERVRYVVDGNNRINQWLAKDGDIEAEVIVIRPRPHGE